MSAAQGVLSVTDGAELRAFQRALELARLERDQARADVRRLRDHLATFLDRAREYLDMEAVPSAPQLERHVRRAQAAVDLSRIHDGSTPVCGDVIIAAHEKPPPA